MRALERGLLSVQVPSAVKRTRRRPPVPPWRTDMLLSAPRTWYLSHLKTRSIMNDAASGGGDAMSTRFATPSIHMYPDTGKGDKRIVAEIKVQARMEEVWDVLTNYEALPTFVPNLERCERLPSQNPGVVLLRQVGCSQSILWRLEAEALLEVVEIKKSPWRKEVRFRMAEGDFDEFHGKWIVEGDVSSPAQMTTFLRYEVSIKPKFSLPSQIVSYIVKAGLPSNIRAVASRAESMAADTIRVQGLASWAGVEVDPAIPRTMPEEGSRLKNNRSDWKGVDNDSMLPSKGPFWPVGSPYAASAPITAGMQEKKAVIDAAKSSYLGTTWVPLPPSGSPEKISVKEVLNEGLQKKYSPLEQYPAFEIDTESQNGNGQVLMDDIEIHLRRLDGLDYLHRRSVAAIRVNAPVSLVWDVITDYDRLAEFIPNLASSERIRLPDTAPSNVVRVRQVGYKNMFYMCLHAESVMDLVEKPYSEVQFRQVAGDVQTFQGKWIVQEALPIYQEEYNGPQTLLKYAVEIVIPTSAVMVSVIEPLLEDVVFEDMPKNLLAMKSEIERIRQQGAIPVSQVCKRPRLADMMKDFRLLQAELEATYGDTQIIPSRAELRAANRTDIEKALAAHGGGSKVASKMGWRYSSRSRKPRGYWNSIENVRHEIDEFILSSDLPPGIMPLKNDIIRAGRFDLARAIEKWGGISILAEELGYDTAQSTSASGSEWQEHVSQTAAATGLSGKQGLFQVASATYRGGDQSTDYILSSADLDDIMNIDAGYDEAKEEELIREMLEQEPQRLSTPSARDEIDSWQ